MVIADVRIVLDITIFSKSAVREHSLEDLTSDIFNIVKEVSILALLFVLCQGQTRRSLGFCS